MFDQRDFRFKEMFVFSIIAVVASAGVARSALVRQEDPEANDGAKVSFLEDVAPILAEHCVGCHNPEKAESRYDMTTFASLAKGGAMGEGIMLEPGDPDLSYFVELIRPDGIPRMPYELDPLSEETRMVIERWVAQGAEYDGDDPERSWLDLVRGERTVTIPDAYPFPLPITALAFSPDGSQILTSGYHEINSYLTSDGSLTRRTPGVGERVYDLAFSPDGTKLATASGDPGQAGYARLWSVDDDGVFGDPTLLVEIEDAAYAVAFSPDGERLAVAGADRAVRIFKVASGEQIGLIEDHADWILDVAFNAEGSRLATASRDKTSKVFEAESFEAIATFPGHGEAVYAVAFQPGSVLVATAGADERVRLWDPDAEAKQAREFQGSDAPVFDLLFINDGEALAAAGADGTVRLFNAENGETLRTLDGHDDWVYRLALSPDGVTLASGSWDGEVRLWPLDDETKADSVILAAPGLAESAAQADGSN